MDNEIKLTDIIDIRTMQELLDAYARAAGLAVTVYDHEGANILALCQTDLCAHTRGTQRLADNAQKDALRAGQTAGRSGRPVFYTAFDGVVEFAVAVTVRGEQIGTIAAGQVLNDRPDTSAMSALASKIGVDPDDYIPAANELKIISKEELNTYAELLLRISGLISRLGSDRLSELDELSARTESISGLAADYEKISEQSVAAVKALRDFAARFESVRKMAQAADRTMTSTDSVLNYVQNVATRMTLLGFNASIEAKHAGEAGAGFNVIAQEVRTLAEQTSGRIRSAEEVLGGVKLKIKNIEQELNAAKEKIDDNIETINALEAAIAEAGEKIKRS